MKTKDLILVLAIALCLSPFFIFEGVYAFYNQTNAAHPYILAFLKFGILATLGECIVLRLRTGNYTQKNYGFAARAILWGLFGVWIAIAMKTFAAGTPFMAKTLGIEKLSSSPMAMRVVTAFLISVMMNTIFAPVFMTLHKITDAHILKHNGKVSSLLKPINMAQGFRDLNWDIQWGFVFKKTIPFFWIPAHTITFLLPPDFQVLFAALLSIALGIILSIAAMRSR